jgi:hypothetical protein
LKSEDRALQEAEKTRWLWVCVYLFAALAFLKHLSQAWDMIHSQPFSWRLSIDAGFDLIVLSGPLLIGLGFRRTIKNELGKNLLSERTSQVCDDWIALLLYAVYLAIGSLHI